jgi:hypothetical protein
MELNAGGLIKRYLMPNVGHGQKLGAHGLAPPAALVAGYYRPGKKKPALLHGLKRSVENVSRKPLKFNLKKTIVKAFLCA